MGIATRITVCGTGDLVCTVRIRSILFNWKIIIAMQYTWNIIAAFTHLHGMFLSADIHFEQCIRLIILDFLYIIFTLQTKDNL